MIDRISYSQMQKNESVIKQAKELSKKIETAFLTEILKIMLADTSFNEDRTVTTYMTVLIPELAEMMAERQMGIGKFLTENPNFLNTLIKNGKIELTPQAQKHPISLPFSGRITSSFGLRTDPIDGKLRQHNGVDIATPEGTPVKPILPGKVVYSGNCGGYGNCVIIEHEEGIQTVYAHNSKNVVHRGDEVTPDTAIALSGSTGRTTGSHLHFEIRKDGKPVNPLAMINNLVKSPIY